MQLTSQRPTPAPTAECVAADAATEAVNSTESGLILQPPLPHREGGVSAAHISSPLSASTTTVPSTNTSHHGIQSVGSIAVGQVCHLVAPIDIFC